MTVSTVEIFQTCPLDMHEAGSGSNGRVLLKACLQFMMASSHQACHGKTLSTLLILKYLWNDLNYCGPQGCSGGEVSP